MKSSIIVASKGKWTKLSFVHGSNPNRLLVAISVMTLQCALIEEILINYFFTFYLFVIHNFEIISKDLDQKGLLRDTNKAQSL